MKTSLNYIRVSTEGQDKGYSPEVQLQGLSHFCQFKGIQCAGVFNDKVSGKNFNRPRFLSMYEAAKKLRPDYILVSDFSRFGREMTMALYWIGKFKEIGCEVQSISQWLDYSDPNHLVMLAIHLSMPQAENILRGLKITSGMRAKMKNGEIPSRAPFGYVNKNIDGNKFVILSEDAHRLKTCFEKFATGNYSVQQLAENYNIPKSNLHSYLSNPVYCGLIVIPANEKEPQQIIEGKHEGIISQTIFYKCQQVLQGRNKKLKTSTLVPELVLRGFIQCECGKIMTGSASTGRNGKHYYYHCHTCKSRIPAKIANNEVENLLAQIKLDNRAQALTKLYIKEILDKNSPKDELKKIETEINKYKGLISKATDLLISGTLGSSQYTEKTSGYQDNLFGLEARKQALNQNSDMSVKIDKAFSLLSDFGGIYKQNGLEAKRKALGSTFNGKLSFSNNKIVEPPFFPIFTFIINMLQPKKYQQHTPTPGLWRMQDVSRTETTLSGIMESITALSELA